MNFSTNKSNGTNIANILTQHGMMEQLSKVLYIYVYECVYTHTQNIYFKTLYVTLHILPFRKKHAVGEDTCHRKQRNKAEWPSMKQ